eukprot:2578248-Amphidinium_carterae.1
MEFVKAVQAASEDDFFACQQKTHKTPAFSLLHVCRNWIQRLWASWTSRTEQKQNCVQVKFEPKCSKHITTHWTREQQHVLD